jgi:hypothetical protein
MNDGEILASSTVAFKQDFFQSKDIELSHCILTYTGRTPDQAKANPSFIKLSQFAEFSSLLNP